MEQEYFASQRRNGLCASFCSHSHSHSCSCSGVRNSFYILGEFISLVDSQACIVRFAVLFVSSQQMTKICIHFGQFNCKECSTGSLTKLIYYLEFDFYRHILKKMLIKIAWGHVHGKIHTHTHSHVNMYITYEVVSGASSGTGIWCVWDNELKQFSICNATGERIV